MEKTNEELLKEIEELKRQNLERELALEKEKAEKANKEEADKKEAILREEIKKECLAELAKESNIDDSGEPTTLEGGKLPFKAFLQKYCVNNDLKGNTYEETLKNISNKGGH